MTDRLNNDNEIYMSMETMEFFCINLWFIFYQSNIIENVDRMLNSIAV